MVALEIKATEIQPGDHIIADINDPFSESFYVKGVHIMNDYDEITISFIPHSRKTIHLMEFGFEDAVYLLHRIGNE